MNERARQTRVLGGSARGPRLMQPSQLPVYRTPRRRNPAGLLETIFLVKYFVRANRVRYRLIHKDVIIQKWIGAMKTVGICV